MGRRKLEVDAEKLIDMADRGFTKLAIADELDISQPTLSRKMAELRRDQGIILEYRDMESLRVTGMKSKLMDLLEERLDAKELDNDQIIRGLGVLMKADKKIDEGGQIEGLIGHLMEVEKRQKEIRDKQSAFQEGTIDVN